MAVRLKNKPVRKADTADLARVACTESGGEAVATSSGAGEHTGQMLVRGHRISVRRAVQEASVPHSERG